MGSIQLDGAKIFSIQGPKKGHQFCLGLYARTRYACHRDKSPVSAYAHSSSTHGMTHTTNVMCAVISSYYLLSARDEPDRVAWLAAIKTVSGAPITSVVRSHVFH